MTPQEDRKNAVYTIQVWLSALYNSGMPIPYVVPDGIYGSQTADTVRIYQGKPCNLGQSETRLRYGFGKGCASRSDSTL